MRLINRYDKALLLAKVTRNDTGTAPVSSSDVNDWAKTSAVDYADLIAECIDLAERENNFSIIAKTCGATYYGGGGNVARLPFGPVISVTSVTADGVAVDTDNYELIGNEVIFEFGQTETVVVTYTTGFGTVPYGIELGLKKMILSNYEDRQDNVIGTGVTNFPNHSRKLFMPYRNF
jgi:hypothetical protein